jgi:hypothetical protein
MRPVAKQNKKDPVAPKSWLCQKKIKPWTCGGVSTKPGKQKGVRALKKCSHQKIFKAVRLLEHIFLFRFSGPALNERPWWGASGFRGNRGFDIGAPVGRPIGVSSSSSSLSHRN